MPLSSDLPIPRTDAPTQKHVVEIRVSGGISVTHQHANTGPLVDQITLSIRTALEPLMTKLADDLNTALDEFETDLKADIEEQRTAVLQMQATIDDLKAQLAAGNTLTAEEKDALIARIANLQHLADAKNPDSPVVAPS